MTSHPPSVVPGSRLRRGVSVAGAKLEELMVRGERIHCWRAQRSDGVPSTLHALVDEAHPREIENFLAGARRLAALTGARPIPGVVEVVAVVPGERLYLARGSAAGTMEDVPLLGWGVRDTLAFVRRLCRSVRELHRRGMVHGSLHPGNVLLDDDLEPKLADAGCVVLDDSYPGAPSDAETDYSAYAAKEVRQGEPATVRSDVFSLGRLLYFALAKERPAEEDEHTPLLERLVGEPPGLVRIVRRCTLREPAGRYPTIDDLLSDLEHHREVAMVGKEHPEGLEGSENDRLSAPASWHGAEGAASSQPPSARPGMAAGGARRGFWTPRAASRRAALSPRARSATPRDPPRRGAPTPRAARATPQETSAAGASTAAAARVAGGGRMKVTLHDARRDDDDVLTSSQARAGAALGALVLLASLVLAYSSAHPSLLAWLGALAGAAGVSFLFPPLGPPWLSRLVVAIVFAATTWFLDPVGAVATAGRRAQLESGSPKERAQRLAQLRARGARDLSNMLLAGGDFRGLDLSATVLDGASLRATNLQRANLAGASVRDADLAAADLSGANLTGVDVSTARGWRAARCDDETVMPTGWVCREEAPHPEGDLEP